jgi:hypothetical protein
VKAVVVHSASARVELDWSQQFAGAGSEAAQELTFPGPHWAVRVRRVFTIPGFGAGANRWVPIVDTIKAAGAAAGTGGVVIVASGHGGAVPLLGSTQFDPDGGMINWDPTETDVGKAWTDRATIKKGLFWDDFIARYLETRQFASPPTRKAEDEAAVKRADEVFQKTGKRPDVSLQEGRLLAFKALDDMGKSLKGAGVRRLAFTNCTAGAATRFMDRLAKIMGVEVACFRETTFVFNDGFETDPKDPRKTRFNSLKGKSRMILERDKKPPGGNGGTNIPSARVFSPDLDNASIAHVGRP